MVFEVIKWIPFVSQILGWIDRNFLPQRNLIFTNYRLYKPWKENNTLIQSVSFTIVNQGKYPLRIENYKFFSSFNKSKDLLGNIDRKFKKKLESLEELSITQKLRSKDDKGYDSLIIKLYGLKGKELKSIEVKYDNEFIK